MTTYWILCSTHSFTPAGKTKAAKAIEAARSHKAMLQAGRKRENEVLAGMKEWQRSHRQSPDNDEANLKNSEKVILDHKKNSYIGCV